MTRSTHHDDYRRLLDLLRDVRRELGITQIDLGRRLDNTQAFVSKFERGERRLDVVEFVEVCDALGVPPLELFARYLAQRQSDVPSGRKTSVRRARRTP
jgi:transcriptional regulator with XRE-family HTH domain